MSSSNKERYDALLAMAMDMPESASREKLIDFVLKDAERHGKTGTAVGAADASDNASTSQERVESTIGDRQSSGSSPSVTTFARQSAPTSSASPFPGIATGSSFTTAAHKFAYASHTAKVMTTRGRPPKAAAPVKIHQGKVSAAVMYILIVCPVLTL
ncbi:unnamed protein product [Tilletia controversa]|nr:unnamed protein product [Tilletia controversa]